jgi:ParB family transcriptional regulator, chromosome partitioning protein
MPVKLMARPLTETGSEIVAGARRYRAAQIAEADTVPVRINNLNDAQALEAQLVEHLICADVHPMEERKVSRRFSIWRSRCTLSFSF